VGLRAGAKLGLAPDKRGRSSTDAWYCWSGGGRWRQHTTSTPALWKEAARSRAQPNARLWS
jgi:hypothetical protein